MRVTVCELPDRPEELEGAWSGLSRHVREAASDLVLLPELPFAPWFGTRREFDGATWQAAVRAHEAWTSRLAELGAAAVLGTRPVDSAGGRYNEAFVWEPGAGPRPAHRKRFLPDEEGFWEASWYQRGSAPPAVEACAGARVAFQICTELWFFDGARELGRKGVHLLAVPRATEAATVDKWLAGGRAAAVVSGAYCLSSNHAGPAAGGSPVFGGRGWIVGPDGDVLATTSRSEPWVTRDVDPGAAERAKGTYPRNVVG